MMSKGHGLIGHMNIQTLMDRDMDTWVIQTYGQWWIRTNSIQYMDIVYNNMIIVDKNILS